jgi:hypothetical protein
MRRLLILIAALAALALPSAAQACRVSIPLEERLATWHEQEMFAAVVVVEVTRTRPLKDPWGGTQVYARSGDVLVARGEDAPNERFEFSDELLISSCNWQNNVEAVVGDRMAVYFWRAASGELEVFLSLPLSEAQRIDPEVRKLMQTRPQVWPIRP